MAEDNGGLVEGLVEVPVSWAHDPPVCAAVKYLPSLGGYMQSSGHGVIKLCLLKH